MPVITLYTFSKILPPKEIVRKLNKKRVEGKWITAKISKYNKNEVIISYWYYEDIEIGLKKAFSEEDALEIVSFLKQNGKTKVLKRTHCFINVFTKTLEVYRGLDSKTEEIVNALEKFLGIKFSPIKIKAKDLRQIYSKHGTELKQAIFKNVEGLMYEILRGKNLENNKKFNEYLKKFPDCLRVISFRPRIRFLNSLSKYQVTLNGDKGTLKFSSNGMFSFRPRFEIRQIVFIIAATIGLLPF